MPDLSRLSEPQRRILELVADGVTASKDIGRMIGKSPGTVDVYLSRAAADLEARGRFDAARIYKELSDLDSKFRTEPLAEPEQNEVSEGTGSAPVSEQTRWIRSLFPPIGGPSDDLTGPLALKLIIQLTAMAGMATAIVVLIYLWTMSQFAKLAS
ncbi:MULTISPECIES: helix-turn-helix transcriptional regulator [unclassified Sphingobium]|uniref:helix-turn-helix domain-containing protein n=1 Tax=unclassified Sphingobium TaxID=2611147 RepID=UPI0035A663DD